MTDVQRTYSPFIHYSFGVYLQLRMHPTVRGTPLYRHMPDLTCLWYGVFNFESLFIWL